MKKNMAVLIVDMQDFFLKNFPTSVLNELIENQKQVILFCLKRNIPFVLLEYKAGSIYRGKTISKLKKIIGASVKEIIIKESNSGFTNTNLEKILKNLNVGTILLIGLNANGCIQDTAISALHRGFKVITSEGIIASSSRNDLGFSKKNKDWYRKKTTFFKNPLDLLTYLAE